MTATKRLRPRPAIEPRDWDTYQVACYLGRSESWLRANLRQLVLREGFPKKDPVLDTFDSEAVKQWRDRRSGFVRDDYLSLCEQNMLQVIKGEQTPCEA